MKHQSKENRASIVLFLLFLCFVTPRAKSQVLLENDSSDVCKVIDIVNVGLSTEIQKKYEKEYIATSVIVGYNLRKNEVEFYWLDDRYDFDLYSLQKGDSITLHYPHMSIDNRKRAIAMDNHSFQERIRENDSIYVDIDLEEVVAYIVKEAKKDEMGEYDPEEVLFVVQGEMEYGDSLGQAD